MNRLYCDVHNDERIRDLGGDPNFGSFKGVKFTKTPDLEKIKSEIKDNQLYELST